MTTPIRIDIFSDVICPWCFIGKRKLEIAAEMHGNVLLDIHWRSFLLNPTMGREGMDRQDYINVKFGPAGASFYDRIAAVGKEVGIDFDFSAIARTPDSRPALALVKSAHDNDQANILKQEMFEAYFIKGQDIGDDSVLSQFAEKYHLPYPSLETHYASVKQDLIEAGQLNIQGIPFIIIEKEWSISGAHAPQSLQPLFDAALSKINTDALDRQ